MASHRHHVSLLGYGLTFVALIVLSGLTLGAAFLELGRWGMVVSLSIAGIKALLIALFFMHLVEQPAANRFAALTAVLLAGLLVGLMVVDIATRPGLQGDVQPRRWADAP